MFTHKESAIFFRKRKLSVVEFVRVFELYLPLPTYVERKTRASNGSPYATGPLSCLSCLYVCNVDLFGQTVGSIKMPLGTEVDLETSGQATVC